MVALGDALRGSREFKRAARYLNQAIVISDGLGDLSNLVDARTDIALTCMDGYSGRGAYVIWQLCMALEAARDLGDRHREANVLANLARAYLKRCQCCHAPPAAESARRAAAIFRELGNHGGEARALAHLDIAGPLAEECPDDAHKGCPNIGQPLAKIRNAGLNGLARAVLRGDHPDAIAIAAAYLNSHKVSGTEYLNRLDETCLGDYSPAETSHPHTVGAAKAALLTLRSLEDQGRHVCAILDLTALMTLALLDQVGPVSGLPDDDVEAAIAVMIDAAVIIINGLDSTTVMSSIAQQVALHRAAHRGTLLDAAAKATSVLVTKAESMIGLPTAAAKVKSIARQVDTVWTAVRATLGKDTWPPTAHLMRLRGLGVNLATSERDRAAVSLATAVLDDCERLLGPTHVETWRARNNLAAPTAWQAIPTAPAPSSQRTYEL